jgi:dephospho-CoA kinase
VTRPYLIGVTGNIGCGKTTVMHELAELGATIIDGDLVYRDLTGPGSPLVGRLAEAFGDQVANPDGSLNRPVLSQIVFSDPEALRALDALTHPVIVAEVEHRIEAASTPVVATDGIKLLESGLGDRCDQVWVVTCDPARQRERLMARSGLSSEEADRRIAAQSPTAEKVARADVVIENDGTLADVRRQVQAAWMEAAAKSFNRGYYADGYET